MWTLFWDMHSGGGLKEKWDKIYIEASEEEAKIIFYNKFGHNPERISCTCCGEDYSISEAKTLGQISGWHRGCAYKKDKYIEKRSEDSIHKRYFTIKEYEQLENVLIIRKKDIKPEERKGNIPKQGYVWV